MPESVVGGACSEVISVDVLQHELFEDGFPKVYTHPESKTQYFRFTTEYPSIDEREGDSRGFQNIFEDYQRRFLIVMASGKLAIYVKPEFSVWTVGRESELFSDIQKLLAQKIANGLLRGTDVSISSHGASPIVMAIGLTMGLLNIKAKN